MNFVYAKPKNLSPKMEEVFADKDLEYEFTKGPETLSDGSRAEPCHFFKIHHPNGHVGVSEDFEDDGKKVYVVSYSTNFLKDRTSATRDRAYEIFKKHSGEPYREMKGGACDYLIYERNHQA